MELVFAPLAARHDRNDFASGSAILDNYLKRIASQDERRNLARVFVGIEPGETRIAGFYALSSFSIGLNLLPQHLGAKLPAYPNVPAALIGRLARHIAYKGRDVGEILLANALRRIALAGRAIDVHVVVVDAKDENAKSFYRRYGFIELAGDPRRLILPVTSIAQTLDV